MKKTIKLCAIDAAFTNVGIAHVNVDIYTLEIIPFHLELITTKKSQDKSVRVSSDKMSRAREIHLALKSYEDGSDMLAAEVPTGGQSASAASSFGLIVGVLACREKPLIQVQQQDVKKATGLKGVGGKAPDKAAIIAYFRDRWPNLPWIKLQKADQKADHNEHLADALGVAIAATRTPEFLQAVGMLRAMNAA